MILKKLQLLFKKFVGLRVGDNSSVRAELELRVRQLNAKKKEPPTL